jgi:hypothetical protein
VNVAAKTMRVLIGYASRFGSTRDIAMRIAGTLRAYENNVDLRSVDEISDCDRYDAVVVREWCVRRIVASRPLSTATAARGTWRTITNR